MDAPVANRRLGARRVLRIPYVCDRMHHFGGSQTPPVPERTFPPGVSLSRFSQANSGGGHLVRIGRPLGRTAPFSGLPLASPIAATFDNRGQRLSGSLPASGVASRCRACTTCCHRATPPAARQQRCRWARKQRSDHADAVKELAAHGALYPRRYGSLSPEVKLLFEWSFVTRSPAGGSHPWPPLVSTNLPAHLRTLSLAPEISRA